jgi:hypothetical protein
MYMGEGTSKDTQGSGRQIDEAITEKPMVGGYFCRIRRLVSKRLCKKSQAGP